MVLPRTIPAGARIVVRTDDGIDPVTGRQTFRDFVGHVISWNAEAGILELHRDASANGQRPAEHVTISADQIVRLKPVPERPGVQRSALHSTEV